MLADLAGHVANSYAQDAGLDPTEVRRRIAEGFTAEMSNQT